MGRLYPYQEDGAQFVAPRDFAVLCDEPGAGKTATAIRAADMAGAERIAVFCPKQVRKNWAKEFAQWQTRQRDLTIVDGAPDTTPGRGVTIMTHATLVDPANLYKLSKGGKFDAIILDEAHEFRALTAARTRNMYSADELQPHSGQYGLFTNTKKLWCLTGTPMVNSAADFYPMVYGPLRYVFDGMTWWDFCNHYTTIKTDSFGQPKPTGIRNTAEFVGKMQPFMLRRTLEGVGITLPPLAVTPFNITLPESALVTIMAGLEGWTQDKFIQALEAHDELRDAAIARVRRVLGLAKVPRIAEEILMMIYNHQAPIVVFFHHTDVCKAYMDYLRPYTQPGYNVKVDVIDGRTKRRDLVDIETRFQNGQTHVLFVQTQAGGTGLTLTRANQTIVAEIPWTAMALWQAIKRMHRISQTRPSFAKVAVANCWLEEILMAVVERKRAAMAELNNHLTGEHSWTLQSQSA